MYLSRPAGGGLVHSPVGKTEIFICITTKGQEGVTEMDYLCFSCEATEEDGLCYFHITTTLPLLCKRNSHRKLRKNNFFGAG